MARKFSFGSFMLLGLLLPFQQKHALFSSDKFIGEPKITYRTEYNIPQIREKWLYRAVE